MTLEHLPLIMIRALAITVCIECAAAYMLGVRDGKSQLTVVMANVITNPLVVSIGAAVMLFIGREALRPVTLVMEMIVVAAEAMLYRGRIEARRSPFVISLICNAASYILGEFINYYLF